MNQFSEYMATNVYFSFFSPHPHPPHLCRMLARCPSLSGGRGSPWITSWTAPASWKRNFGPKRDDELRSVWECESLHADIFCVRWFCFGFNGISHAGVKWIFLASPQMRGSCSRYLWTRAEDVWSFWSRSAPVAGSPSRTSPRHPSTSRRSTRISWTTTSVPNTLYVTVFMFKGVGMSYLHSRGFLLLWAEPNKWWRHKSSPRCLCLGKKKMSLINCHLKISSTDDIFRLWLVLLWKATRGQHLSKNEHNVRWPDVEV